MRAQGVKYPRWNWKSTGGGKLRRYVESRRISSVFKMTCLGMGA